MSRALISTLAPLGGGVPQMAEFIASLLQERDIEPVFAYYQPYSLSPSLSVPSYRLVTGRIAKKMETYHGIQCHAIGARLPEFEFMNYRSNRYWNELIGQSNFHLSVSGNCLAASPFLGKGIPFWSWVATDWLEDRIQRAAAFPVYRKLVDRLINNRMARRTERKVLQSSGTVVALSEYTRNRLNSVLPGAVDSTMPMAIDTTTFAPARNHTGTAPLIGFAGRLNDPRKNIGLLLEATRYCREANVDVRLLLIGNDDPEWLSWVRSFELGGAVTTVDYIDRAHLPQWLNRLDVFVVPSWQEGLCIAALEAMSCGVPVVATRCGGPEEYVRDHNTGYLVDSNPPAMGEAILRIIADKELKNKLSGNARDLVQRRYSNAHVRDFFWRSFERTFCNRNEL